MSSSSTSFTTRLITLTSSPTGRISISIASLIILISLWKLRCAVRAVGGWKNAIGHMGLALARQRRRVMAQRRPKRIVLVRHGESQGQIDANLYGHVPDNQLPMSAKGFAQATEAGKELKKLFGDESISIFVSPFLRTRQTLACILKSFPLKQVVSLREDPRLREQEWGNYQNPVDMPRIFDERNTVGRFYYRFESGESGADVFDRISSFWETLYRDMDQENRAKADNYLIVTHGLTMRFFLQRYLRWNVEKFESVWNAKNCEYWILERVPPSHAYQLVTDIAASPPLEPQDLVPWKPMVHAEVTAFARYSHPPLCTVSEENKQAIQDAPSSSNSIVIPRSPSVQAAMVPQLTTNTLDLIALPPSGGMPPLTSTSSIIVSVPPSLGPIPDSITGVPLSQANLPSLSAFAPPPLTIPQSFTSSQPLTSLAVSSSSTSQLSGLTTSPNNLVPSPPLLTPAGQNMVMVPIPGPPASPLLPAVQQAQLAQSILNNTFNPLTQTKVPVPCVDPPSPIGVSRATSGRGTPCYSTTTVGGGTLTSTMNPLTSTNIPTATPLTSTSLPPPPSFSSIATSPLPPSNTGTPPFNPMITITSPQSALNASDNLHSSASSSNLTLTQSQAVAPTPTAASGLTLSTIPTPMNATINTGPMQTLSPLNSPKGRGHQRRSSLPFTPVAVANSIPGTPMGNGLTQSAFPILSHMSLSNNLASPAPYTRSRSISIATTNPVLPTQQFLPTNTNTNAASSSLTST